MSEFKSNKDTSEEAWALGIGLGIVAIIIVIIVALQISKRYSTIKTEQPPQQTEVPLNVTLFSIKFYQIAA